MQKNILRIRCELQKVYTQMDTGDNDLELARHLISMACLELDKAEKTNRMMHDYGF